MVLTIAKADTLLEKVTKLLEELEELKAGWKFHRHLLVQNKLSIPCGLKLKDVLEYADMLFEQKSFPICEQIDEALRHKKLSLLPYDSNHVCDVCQEKKASYTLTRLTYKSSPRVNYVCNAATCGHFLMKEPSQGNSTEDLNTFGGFFMRLSIAATARETAQ
jgi:hypothetical protein